MSRITELHKKVNELYKSGEPDGAEDWAEYLHSSHIFLVADKAGELATRFGAKKELAMAAGMLHDVADAVMKRQDQRHAGESEKIATQLLKECAFNDEEIQTIVGDAMRKHSCRGIDRPRTLEGKAMASADAVVHLTTDFYDFAIRTLQKRGETREEIKKWGLEKIDRDLNTKIFFDEVREEVRADYNAMKKLFSSL